MEVWTGSAHDLRIDANNPMCPARPAALGVRGSRSTAAGCLAADSSTELDVRDILPIRACAGESGSGGSFIPVCDKARALGFGFDHDEGEKGKASIVS